SWFDRTAGHVLRPVFDRCLTHAKSDASHSRIQFGRTLLLKQYLSYVRLKNLEQSRRGSIVAEIGERDFESDRHLNHANRIRAGNTHKLLCSYGRLARMLKVVTGIHNVE